MDETPSGTTVEVYEAQSYSMSMASRNVSRTLSLPVQYRPTHVRGWPDHFKSEENDKSRAEKDTNRANSIIKHPRTWLLHCTGVMSCKKTGRSPSQTKVLASINKQNVLTIPLAHRNQFPVLFLEIANRILYCTGTLRTTFYTYNAVAYFRTQDIVVRLELCGACSQSHVPVHIRRMIF